MTVLITSIPPCFRNNLTTTDNTNRYNWQRLCINSWYASGHEVFSMNDKSEINELKAYFPDVNFIQSDRSTIDINGKPLIYISDALNWSKNLGLDRLAIINADIVISEVDQKMQNEKRTFLFSNRINIENENSTTGEFFGGIDYFNLSNEFITMLPESLFCFGLPWWDYWLPIQALKNQITIYSLSQDSKPILLHKKHKDAWNSKEFMVLGAYFFDTLFNNYTTIRPNSLFNLFNNFDSEKDGNPNMLDFSANLARNISYYINNSAEKINL